MSLKIFSKKKKLFYFLCLSFFITGLFFATGCKKKTEEKSKEKEKKASDKEEKSKEKEKKTSDKEEKSKEKRPNFEVVENPSLKPTADMSRWLKYEGFPTQGLVVYAAVNPDRSTWVCQLTPRFSLEMKLTVTKPLDFPVLVEVIKDKNGNQQRDKGEVLKKFKTANPEGATYRVKLSPGRYYVRMSFAGSKEEIPQEIIKTSGVDRETAGLRLDFMVLPPKDKIKRISGVLEKSGKLTKENPEIYYDFVLKEKGKVKINVNAKDGLASFDRDGDGKMRPAYETRRQSQLSFSLSDELKPGRYIFGFHRRKKDVKYKIYFKLPIASGQPGSLKWSFRGPKDIDSSPALAKDGTIYVTCEDGYLYAIKKDGSEKWKCKVGGKVDGTPTVAKDGTIYVSHQNKLHAISPGGTKKWTFGGNKIKSLSDPAVDQKGIIYVGTRSGYLYLLKPDGMIIEKFKVVKYGGSVRQLSLTPGGSLVFTTSGNTVRSYTKDGKKQWALGLSQVYSLAIGPKGTIFAGSNKGGTGTLYAITPEGKEKWKTRLQGKFYRSLTVGPEGLAYLSTNKGYAYCISPKGKIKWKLKTSRGAQSSPVIGANGTVYFPSNRRITAINPRGKEKWRYDLKGFTVRSSPLIDQKGILYVGSAGRDGQEIHALYTGSKGMARGGWPCFRGNLQRTGMVQKK